MKANKFKNQYIISNKKIICKMKELNLNGLNLYIQDINQIAIMEKNNKAIIILGTFFDPINCVYNDKKIVQRLYENTETITDFINQLSYISGRYIAILKKFDEIFVISDPLGLKNIFYYYDEEDNFYITYNPKIFEEYGILQINVKDDIKKIISNWKFQRKEMDWKSNKWYDTRIRQLIANHFLEIKKKREQHIQYYLLKEYQQLNKEELIKKIVEILENSIDYLTTKYKCRMGITGGYDSRVLLACSKKYKSRIEFYTYRFKNVNAADYKIAHKLCKKIGTKYTINKTKRLSKVFMEKYKSINKFPRILPKTENIQWAYYNLKSNKYININGNAFNVSYSQPSWNIDFVDKIMEENKYYKQTYKTLKPEIIEFEKESKIPFGSISIWEIRGLWVSQYPLEQDIAVEEITPFDNRVFIYLCNLLDQKIPGNDYKKLNVELIKYMAPELLEIEFNRNSLQERVTKKIKSIIKKVIKY